MEDWSKMACTKVVGMEVKGKEERVSAVEEIDSRWG
jgi:hypothetical protein